MNSQKNQIILIFLILISLNSFSQKENIDTKTIVKKIAENGYYSPAPDGFFTVNSSSQFLLSEELERIATIDELITLTNHKSPAVRVYSIQALDNRNYPNLFNIIIKHIDDTKEIKADYHISRNIYVGEFFVAVKNLPSNQRQTLDSVLLFRDNKLNYTNRILEDIKPLNKNYTRIRELATKREFAIIALAKYKREEDVELIQSLLLKNHYFSIEAIEYFPHKKFKITLSELREKGFNYYGTYFSVAVFQDTFSTNYFNSKLDELENNDFKRKQEGEYILQAISKYRNLIYDSLFFKLWEKDYIINDSTFTYLLTVDSVKCKRLTIISINNASKIDNSTLVLVDFLNYIIQVDQSLAISLIADNLLSVNVNEFRYFSEASQKIREKNITKSLFARLEKSENGHIFIPITETILSYNDPELNAKLISIIKNNPKIEGWGLDEVKKMLNEQGLKL